MRKDTNENEEVKQLKSSMSWTLGLKIELMEELLHLDKVMGVM